MSNEAEDSKNEAEAWTGIEDIAFVELPVTIGGEEYVLCEASGETARKYKNRQAEMVTMADGKVTKITKPADLEPLLVSLCLKKVIEGGNRKSVSLAVIGEWPAKTVTNLADKAKEISGLGDDENPTQGDKPSDTEDG